MLTRLSCLFLELRLNGARHIRDAFDRLKAKGQDDRGAITIEYILIIALIAIIIITLFTILLWPILRPALEDLINRIQQAIAGEGIN